MNIQELQTIRGYSLPIKIFVMDNSGYGMIKQTQSDWPEFLESGVACNPYMNHLRDVAKCNGFKYTEINGKNDYWKIPIALSEVEPILIKVHIPENCIIISKLKFGDEMTDLTPKLTHEQKREIRKILL